MRNKNISYEPRELNVIFTESKSGSTTTKLSVPITWLRRLGVTKEDREVKISIEDNRIVIEKLGG